MLSKKSSLDKSSYVITNYNNAGKKMLPSSDQEMVSIQNIEVANKSPNSLTKITNESAQKISITKQLSKTTCSSEVLNKNSTFDKSSSMITNDNNIAKKILPSSDQEMV